MQRDQERINRALKRYYEGHRAYLPNNGDISDLVDEGLLKRANLRDQWGHPYRVQWWQTNCTLQSAGPDGKWNTSDDLSPMRVVTRGGLAGGGGRGGIVEEMPMLNAVEARAAAPAAAWERQEATDKALATTPPGEPAQPQVRLRQFFPETMYVNPALITDARGQASTTVQMADSITTWRLQALASSQRGQLGSTSQGLRVFQDFFVDIDLPVAPTQHDEVSIPVAVYNYLPKAQPVTLTLETQPWFELLKGEAKQSLALGPSDIKVVY